LRDSVRRAAVLIGGGGAVLGALLYPLVIVLWAVIRVLSGLSLRPTDVDLAFVGPLAVASVCCVAAAWGAWLVFTGETHDAIQRGALLILVAALGCAAAITARNLAKKCQAYSWSNADRNLKA
jgi:hypothetical protein